MADDEKDSGSWMKDLGKDLRLQLQERASSPLIGSFVLSWLVWNYRLIMVLLSDQPVAGRFQYIDTALYGHGWSAAFQLFLGPLLCALTYIFLYPVITKWINGYWFRKQNELKKQRDEIEGARLLTVEESQAVMRDAYRVRREALEEIQRLSTDLEGLRTVQPNAAAAPATASQHSADGTGEAEALEKIRRSLIELEARTDHGHIHLQDMTSPVELSEDMEKVLQAAHDAPVGIRVVETAAGHKFLEAGASKLFDSGEPVEESRGLRALADLETAGLLFREKHFYKLTPRALRLIRIPANLRPKKR